MEESVAVWTRARSHGNRRHSMGTTRARTEIRAMSRTRTVLLQKGSLGE